MLGGAGKCSIPRGPPVPTPSPLLPRRGGWFTELGATSHPRVSVFASGLAPSPSAETGCDRAGCACTQEGHGGPDPGRLARATQVAQCHVCVWSGVPPGPGQGAGPSWRPQAGWVGPRQGVSQTHFCLCGPWPCGWGYLLHTRGWRLRVPGACWGPAVPGAWVSGVRRGWCRAP